MDEIICFDLDNTLVCSDEAHTVAFNAGLRRIGWSEVPCDCMKHLFGRPKHDVVRLLTHGATQKQREMVLQVHDSVLRRSSVKYARRIPGVLIALKQLHQRYRLALVSNCSQKSILSLLTQVKINPGLFSLIVGPTDVVRPKPYPDEIRYVQRQLRGRVVYMVGDSIYDIRAAHAAHVRAVAVLTGNSTREILKKERPYKIIGSVCELPEEVL